MPFTRAQAPALLERGIREVYDRFGSLRGKQYEKLYNVHGSEKATETDAVYGDFAQYEPQVEGNTWNYDNMAEAWTKTYIHLEYTKGIQVTRIAMEDDLYGVLKRLIKMGGRLGEAALYTQEVLAMAPFNNLAATVYTADGTGYPLLSTTQFRVDGDTWANRPALAVDFSLEALETMLVLWRTQMVDQRGKKLMVQPKKLLHGPSDQSIVYRTLKSSLRPGGNDNDPNFVAAAYDIEPFTSDFLTDDGRWFLLGAKEQTGMNWFNKRKLMMERFDISENGNLVFLGSFRSSVGLTHVTAVAGSP